MTVVESVNVTLPRQVVDLLVKKITHAPDTCAPQPFVESSKTMGKIMGLGPGNPVNVEARLDKEVYLFCLQTLELNYGL